jgi:hypothetical protein
MNLQSYFKITTIGIERSTLQQHKEATMLCEEGMTIAKTRITLLVPQSTKQATSTKT